MAITAEVMWCVLRNHDGNDQPQLGEPFDRAIHFVRIAPGVCEPIAAMCSLPNQAMKAKLREMGFHTMRTRHGAGPGQFEDPKDHSLLEH